MPHIHNTLEHAPRTPGNVDIAQLYSSDQEVTAPGLTTASEPRSERGEGVMSMAIAVLIIALLGLALWVGFKALVDKTNSKADNAIEQIG